MASTRRQRKMLVVPKEEEQAIPGEPTLPLQSKDTKSLDCCMCQQQFRSSSELFDHVCPVIKKAVMMEYPEDPARNWFCKLCKKHFYGSVGMLKHACAGMVSEPSDARSDPPRRGRPRRKESSPTPSSSSSQPSNHEHLLTTREFLSRRMVTRGAMKRRFIEESEQSTSRAPLPLFRDEPEVITIKEETEDEEFAEKERLSRNEEPARLSVKAARNTCEYGKESGCPIVPKEEEECSSSHFLSQHGILPNEQATSERPAMIVPKEERDVDEEAGNRNGEESLMMPKLEPEEDGPAWNGQGQEELRMPKDEEEAYQGCASTSNEQFIAPKAEPLDAEEPEPKDEGTKKKPTTGKTNNKRKYKCPKCEEQFEKQIALALHLCLPIMADKKVHCPECFFRHWSRTHMRTHIRIKHGIFCATCGNIFPLGKIENHIKRCVYGLSDEEDDFEDLEDFDDEEEDFESYLNSIVAEADKPPTPEDTKPAPEDTPAGPSTEDDGIVPKEEKPPVNDDGEGESESDERVLKILESAERLMPSRKSTVRSNTEKSREIRPKYERVKKEVREKKYQCPICEEWHEEELDLATHICLPKNEDGQVKCSECRFKHYSRFTVRNHIRAKHGVPCLQCMKIMPVSEITEHVKFHNMPYTWTSTERTKDGRKVYKRRRHQSEEDSDYSESGEVDGVEDVKSPSTRSQTRATRANKYFAKNHPGL